MTEHAPDRIAATRRVYQTRTRLADGRELIYFDEHADVQRDLVDGRDLPHVENRSQTRFDTLAGEWVTIAEHRQTRTYRPPAASCPLCPSTPGNASEIPASNYDVVVFENRFPAFAGDGPSPASASQLNGQPPADPAAGPGASEARPGHGRCEVVCFTPEHTATMSSLPDRRIRTVMEAWTDRSRELARHPAVEQVFCFENRGAEIGVTLDHPHGQIYGYPFVTPATRTMLDQADRYRRAHHSNLFADLLDNESRGPRVVASNDNWLAFVPFASRWPIEVHLYPRRRAADLPALTDDDRDAFVPIYREVLRRMEGLYDEPLPAITAWHQAPVRAAHTDFWTHLRLFSIRRSAGKIKYLAGSESAMGAFVNDSTPESMADRLREVAL